MQNFKSDTTALVHVTYGVEVDLLNLRRELGRTPTKRDVEREASSLIRSGDAQLDEVARVFWRVG